MTRAQGCKKEGRKLDAGWGKRQPRVWPRTGQGSGRRQKQTGTGEHAPPSYSRASVDRLPGQMPQGSAPRGVAMALQRQLGVYSKVCLRVTLLEEGANHGPETPEVCNHPRHCSAGRSQGGAG